MRKFISTALLGTALLSLAVVPTFAEPMHKDAMAAETALSKDHVTKDAMVESVMKVKSSGAFAQKKYRVKGQFEIIEKDGQTVLRLSDDFKTKAGPDLKLFLSPQSAQNITGATATQGAINLGALVKHNGGSDYIIPAGTDLSAFNSVLVHCEQFSVLWAAGTI